MKIIEIGDEVTTKYTDRTIRYRRIKIEDSFGQKTSVMFYNHDVEHVLHLALGKVGFFLIFVLKLDLFFD